MYNVFVNIKLSDSLVRLGFKQALGVTLYCALIGIFFWKGNEIFGKVPNYAGPVAFLLLFSLSALICALIVFYQPYKLFFDGNLPAGRQGKNEAVDLVLATTGWLFISFLVFLSLAVFIG